MSVERLLSKACPQRRTPTMRPSAALRLTAPKGFHCRRAGLCAKTMDRPCIRRMTAAAGSGKETSNSRPSVSALQRKTKSWLEQELRLRGVPPPPGTKADLAAELHAAWEVEEVQRPAASLAAAGGGEDAAAGDSSELAAADSSAGKPKGRPRSGKTKTAPKKDDRSSMTEKYTALRVVDLREQLVTLGLPKSGNKALLVERLVDNELKGKAKAKGKVTHPPAAHAWQLRRVSIARASGMDMARASKANENERSSDKHPPLAKKERGPRSKTGKEQQKPASSSKQLEDADEEGPSQFQEELERLRKEVREREETLEELHTKLLKAESARSVDSGLLAEMQESVRQLQEQRRQWRESLRGRSVEELRASAEELEARLKPELKAQLEELEAIVEGLEQETALKADVVQQLTQSLNRSLAAPSAGKGRPCEIESQPKQEDEAGSSEKIQSNGAKDGPTPQQGSASNSVKKTGPGSIGIALAAGVISVLNGWSLGSGIRSSTNQQGTAPDEKKQDE